MWESGKWDAFETLMEVLRCVVVCPGLLVLLQLVHTSSNSSNNVNISPYCWALCPRWFFCCAGRQCMGGKLLVKQLELACAA